MATARKKKRRKKNSNKRNEIAGIIIIGLAIFIAITIYMSIDSVFGNLIKDVVFGLCGILGYVVPVIIGIIGVLFIASRKKNTNAGKLVLLGLAVLFVFSLVNLSVAGDVYVAGSDFGTFVKGSYGAGMQT